MAKPAVKWPHCRCNGFYHSPNPYYYDSDRWHYTSERGEYVPVQDCKKNLGCVWWICYPCSLVKACERCGILGNPKYVRYRSDCYLGYSKCDWDRKLDMCMSCWNRTRPFVGELNRLHDARKLLGKLRRMAVESRMPREDDRTSFQENALTK